MSMRDGVQVSDKQDIGGKGVGKEWRMVRKWLESLM
jgi:hypothetical protein